jgi:hypothetical protein
MQYIDAEVVSLDTYFQIDPEMSIDEIRPAVIEYERQRFVCATRLDAVLPTFRPHFTAPGGYDVLLSHIRAHGELVAGIGGRRMDEEESLRSWYSLVYKPIAAALREQRLLQRFPDRTEADLYVWVVRHWELLRQEYLPSGLRKVIGDLAPLRARRRGVRPSDPTRPLSSENAIG